MGAVIATRCSFLSRPPGFLLVNFLCICSVRVLCLFKAAATAYILELCLEELAVILFYLTFSRG